MIGSFIVSSERPKMFTSIDAYAYLCDPALTRPNCVIDWIEPNLNRVFEHAAIERHNVPAAPTAIHQVTKHLTVVVAKSFKPKVMAEHYFDVTFTTRYDIIYYYRSPVARDSELVGWQFDTRSHFRDRFYKAES